jgi:hypothetical protein
MMTNLGFLEPIIFIGCFVVILMIGVSFMMLLSWCSVKAFETSTVTVRRHDGSNVVVQWTGPMTDEVRQAIEKAYQS